MTELNKYTLTTLAYKSSLRYTELEFTPKIYTLIENPNSFHPTIKYLLKATLSQELLEICSKNSLNLHLEQTLTKGVFIDPYQLQSLLDFKDNILKEQGIKFNLRDTPIELELPVDKISDEYVNVYDIYWNFNTILSDKKLAKEEEREFEAEFELPLFGRYHAPNPKVYNNILLPKTKLTLACYSASNHNTQPTKVLTSASEQTLSQEIVIPSANPNLDPYIPYITWYIVATALIYLLRSLINSNYKQKYKLLPNTDPNYTLIELAEREVDSEGNEHNEDSNDYGKSNKLYIHIIHKFTNI
jgi:hypothetical protein